MKGRAIYRLPKDEPRRSKWIAAIKRAKSNVNKTEKWHPSDSGGYRLCSNHFISGKPVTKSVNHVNVTSVYSELNDMQLSTWYFSYFLSSNVHDTKQMSGQSVKLSTNCHTAVW